MAVTGRLSAQIVHFPDRNLESALSSQLGVAIGTITTNEMLGLTYFYYGQYQTSGTPPAWKPPGT